MQLESNHIQHMFKGESNCHVLIKKECVADYAGIFLYLHPISFSAIPFEILRGVAPIGKLGQIGSKTRPRGRNGNKNKTPGQNSHSTSAPKELKWNNL